MPSYLVTDDWYDRAVNAAKHKGDIPLSWVHHIDNSIEELDWFGCCVEEYTLESIVRQPTIQTVTAMSRGWKVGNAMTKVPWQTGARAFHANCSFTADSLTSANLIVQRAKLSIKNNINLELGQGIGDQRVQQPRLGKQDVTFEFDFLNRESNTWEADARNTTAQLIDATIVWHPTLTSTMTNLKVISNNENEIRSGIYQHKVICEQGVGFTIA